MSTATKEDFTDFCDYLRSFSLRDALDQPEKSTHLRLAHAKFLALLSAFGEMLSDSGTARSTFSDSYGLSGENYLREVISDCSEFIICIVLGLNRAAGGTLRSAIESYLKTFSAHEAPQILERSSVPQVFSDAATAQYFSTRKGRETLASLKVSYAELNAFVHTTSAEHMFKAPAVGKFPRWSEKNVGLIEIFVRVVRLFLYCLVGSRKDIYDNFDYRNKVIVNRAMTRPQRRSALGVDD